MVQKIKGFSLVELLIVVGILSVLVAIAVPQFENFVAKSKRTEGILTLESVHKAQLSYFASHSTFATWGSGQQPIEIEIPYLKFYRLNTLWITKYLPGQFGATEDHYVAFLYGNIEKRNADNDELCIMYPLDFLDCVCDLSSMRGPIGEVVIYYDDIRNKYCFD